LYSRRDPFQRTTEGRRDSEVPVASKILFITATPGPTVIGSEENEICNNPQIRGEFLEATAWAEVCKLLKNPERLQKKPEQKLEIARNAENLNALKSDLGKLQRGIERLIDSYSDGAIDKEQFTSRLSRTKGRIADLDAKIRSNTGGFDHGRQLRILVDHFRKLAEHLGRGFAEADWNRRRDIMRSLIDRIEIGHVDLAIIFRTPSNLALSKDNPIVLRVSRE
jgi:site-specific DNA recombinase